MRILKLGGLLTFLLLFSVAQYVYAGIFVGSIVQMDMCDVAGYEDSSGNWVPPTGCTTTSVGIEGTTGNYYLVDQSNNISGTQVNLNCAPSVTSGSGAMVGGNCVVITPIVNNPPPTTQRPDTLTPPSRETNNLSRETDDVSDSLVTSGRDIDYNPDGYGSCEFVALVNNVILFLIKITAVLAVIVFIYAGYLMLFSMGDSAQIAQAKGLFANVLIGFVIMLAAFLIVNTVLGVLVGGVSGGITWQKVECQYAHKSVAAAVVDVESNVHTGFVSPFTPVIIGSMPTSGSTGNASCTSAGLVTGDTCYAPNRCQVGNTRAACPRISTYESYINAAARKYNIPADRIRGIMITESSGNPNARSPVGALGLMQLMPATARASCGLSSADLLVPSKNIDCGAKYYAQQYRSFGSHNLAAAAYNAGPGGNNPSNSCPGLSKWQCPFDVGGCCSSGTVTATTCKINTGYAETRKYVDKVNAASPECR